MCKASGRTPASLLKPLLEMLSPPLEKRRLMPLKHVQLQMGNAAAFTYCMQQKPPLLPLSQVCASSLSGYFDLLSESGAYSGEFSPLKIVISVFHIYLCVA